MLGRARTTGSRVLLLTAISAASALTSGVLAQSASAVGFQGPSFASTGVVAPTADKPQSKLWFNDGSWWAVMYDVFPNGRYDIHRLDSSTQTWIDTGVAVDDRKPSYSDVLWDGTHLYVASITPTDVGRLYRYSYDPSTKTYSLDLGFPLTLTSVGAETITVAKDTAGKLWASWTEAGQVMVTHSTSSESTFAAPFEIPVSGASGVNADDISAVVAYSGRIGVLWSNQADGRMHFATHVDGAPPGSWSDNPINAGPLDADDHLNVKAIDGDPAGQVFAVFKTSRVAGGDPLLVLGVLAADGTWSTHTVSTVADGHTRAQVVLDPVNRRVNVFFSSPCCAGGTIYRKQADMDSIAFAAGDGTPFIQLASDPNANNPTSTKQPVGPATGLVVLAGDDSTKRYVHNQVDLGAADTIAPETSITSSPPAEASSTGASFEFDSNEAGSTFDCSLDGAAFTPCTSPVSYSGLTHGPHTFEVRATDPSGNVDASPARYAWAIDPAGTLLIGPAADSYVDEASPDLNRGSEPTLRVDGGAGVHQESYLRFVVPDLGGRPVTSARLRLYLSNGSVNAPSARGADNAWSEAGITWNTRPVTTTGVLDNLGAVEPISFVEWDVSAHVSGEGPHSLALLTESVDAIVANSREASFNPPRLVITTGPQPPDTTPPDTRITAAPPATTASPEATFEFASTEDSSTFECSLDGAGFASCSSPHVLSGLAPGDHEFQVRATDAAGNVDPNPAEHRWTVEAPQPPEPVETRFPAEADAYVDQKDPDDNDGEKKELKVKANKKRGQEKERQAYLRFRPTDLRGTVVSARVRLYVKKDVDDGPAIRGTSPSWSEMRITWDNRPRATTRILDDAGELEKKEYVELDVTEHVRTNGDVSFVLVAEDPKEAKFSSREEKRSERRPQLVVTTRPGTGVARAAAWKRLVEALRACDLSSRGARAPAWRRAAEREICRSRARALRRQALRSRGR